MRMSVILETTTVIQRLRATTLLDLILAHVILVSQEMEREGLFNWFISVIKSAGLRQSNRKKYFGKEMKMVSKVFLLIAKIIQLIHQIYI